MQVGSIDEKGLGWFTNRGKINVLQLTMFYYFVDSPSHLHHLPPVKTKPHPPPQLLPAKKKTRCFTCGKKTGLATTYQCR